MRILVIGAGAVGGFLGARAALAGHDVTLVGRRPFADAVTAQGLALVEPDGAVRTAAVTAFDTLQGALASEPFDLALLTVKAYDTAEVAKELLHAAAALPPIVTLQNGVGNEETLAAALGPAKVIAGAIETPVSLPAPGRVQVHRARFRIGLAAVDPATSLAPALGLLNSAGLVASAVGDYRRLKWSKLLLNLPGNALCAITDFTPAQVMADRVASRLEALAWQEAFRVVRGLGLRPVALAGYPLDLIAPLARLAPPALLARALARTVAGGRGTKAPSLHMALAAGRRSEVDWLNGAVVRAAGKLGIPAPVNRAYTEILTALTEGRATREAWRGRPERVLAEVRG